MHTHTHTHTHSNVQTLKLERLLRTGTEFLPGLDVQEALETYSRQVHSIRTRGKHAEKKQHSVQVGGKWGGLCQSFEHSSLRLSATLPHVCQLQVSSRLPWWRQLHLPQQVVIELWVLSFYCNLLHVTFFICLEKIFRNCATKLCLDEHIRVQMMAFLRKDDDSSVNKTHRHFSLPFVRIKPHFQS